MDKIRLVLAGDHGLLRAGVRAVLAKIEDVEIVGEAANGIEALQLVASFHPDILLTDLSMDGLGGLELIRLVTREFPDTLTIALSMHAEKEYVSQALRGGARGYLIKERGTDELERAIRSVASGGTYLSSAISGHVVREYVRLTERYAQEHDPLTPRQREVLKLIAEGLTTKAIARRLDISVKTADTHRVQLMERLGIHDVAGLVRYAIRTGLVHPGV